MVFLIVCEPQDLSALWLSRELEVRGQSVDVIIPDELIINSELSLFINTKMSSAELQLASGRVIDAHSVNAIFNRMQRFPAPENIQLSDQDFIYATEEIRAAIVAWLHAIESPVFCPPSPYASTGENVSDLIWRYRMSQLGMISKPIAVGGVTNSTQPNKNTVHVLLFDTKLLASGSDHIPPDVAVSVKRLASIYSPGCITANFEVSADDTWLFLSVEPLPDLSLFGKPLIDIVSKWIDAR